jgi:hypothetical protein
MRPQVLDGAGLRLVPPASAVIGGSHVILLGKLKGPRCYP